MRAFKAYTVVGSDMVLPSTFIEVIRNNVANMETIIVDSRVLADKIIAMIGINSMVHVGVPRITERSEI